MGDIVALGNAPGASPATETYSYDPLHRLTGITDAGTALETYTYNQTGDRLSKTAPGLAAGAYLYTTGTHKLASVGSAARTNDANGNTTGSIIGGNTYGFSYNDRNRLALTQLNGVTDGTYTYNALGERIGKVATSPQAVTERYAYNEAGQLIGEYGTTNRDYIWVGALPVAVVDNTINGSTITSVVNYVTADHLDTPRAVSNSAGTVIWSWAYKGNPFGEQAPTSTTGYTLNLRYPGQYFDVETGLNYNGNRYYDSTSGRYLQSDPIGLAGGISTFGYVGGNPLSNIDPLGLESPRAASGCGNGGWSSCASNPPAIPSCTEPCGCKPPNLGLLATIVATEVVGLGPEDPLADALVAEEIAAADTVTVGRVMSQAELDAMTETGQVQESFNNGVTSVTLPPSPTAYAAGPSGDVFVQFDVPESSIGASDGTVAKIYGPNSIFGPVKGITQMPPATNIVVPGQ